MKVDPLKIHAMVDGELEGTERAEVQQAINTCSECEAEWLAIKNLKLTVSQKCIPAPCDDIWNACRKRLDGIDRTKGVESFVGRYAWAICAVFFCVILGAAFMHRAGGTALNAGDIATASLAPISAPRAQDPDAKRHWLQDNLDRAMPARPELLNVVGGAVGYMPDGRKIARADLQDRTGHLKFYVVQASDRWDGVEKVTGHTQYSGTRINDVNCITWTGNGCAYVLLGDRPVDALCEVADQLVGTSR